ncbi:DUF3772 domain-containing protein [Maritimibacter dapengensis]|uniref:DUF3772 domain-containing protein n=1 Tax=Maritimibacter dapengensis TaxID=2836868 RepID=A0ABS6T2Y2_9RHOB|nr:DUF3772 domain-containing protein [Maritimibacter dapengensis]MBV7379611.1 DUF3772 domain-containing protein [Maritimibacter dapengensis]
MTRTLGTILAALLVGLALTVTSAVAQGEEPEINAPMVQSMPAQEEAQTVEVKASPAAELAATVDMPADAPDYEAWAKVATRAEQALETGRASEEALSSLRAEVVSWRSQFADARGENAVRITTLKTQIEALGPPPGEEGSESGTRTAQREALNDQLALIETPVVVADIAHARADSIISEIDELLRSRTADTLFTPLPSPINPAHWPRALSDLGATATSMWHEAREAVTSDTHRAQMRQSFAALAVFVGLAVILLLRGRRWVVKAGNKVQGIATGPARGVWGFLISLGQMIAPILGVLSIFIAVSIMGLLDGRPGYFFDLLNYTLIYLIIARWVGSRVFGQPGADWAVLNLVDVARSEGRFEAAALGATYGVYRFLDDLYVEEGYSEATLAVLSLPVLLVGAILMFRMGRLLRSHSMRAEDESAEGEGIGFRDRTLSLAGGALMVIGVVGPLVHLTGYVNFAQYVLWNTALSLALVGLLLALHRFYTDLYGLIFRKSVEEADQALVPILVSLLTLVIATPLFALIWGAREAELAEIWASVGEGVSLGEAVITPSDILILIVVFVIGYTLTRLVQGMLRATVLPKTSIDVGGRNAITSGIGYVGYFLAAIIAITAAGINLSSLAIVAGALSVGVGFGLQAIVSNFVSGIILLIERPISEGDWISVGGHMGIVKDISVRSTRIETFDRQDVVVPNSDFISGTVTNYTRGNKVGRLVINIGVAYGTDTRRVSEILMEIVMDHPLISVNPAPQVGFMAFGADSLDFQIRAMLSDVTMILIVQDEINHTIAERFSEEGIEIPFAQRDIWIRNPETLHAPQRHESSAQDTTRTDPADQPAASNSPAGLDADVDGDGD